MAFRKNDLILALLLVLSVLPNIILLGNNVPVLFLLIPIGLFILFLVVLGRVTIPKIVKVFLIFFLLIVIEIILSSIIGSVSAFGTFMFPNDVIQYIARFLCFVCFLLLFFHSKVKTEVFIKLFLIVLIWAMSVGILQWISWPGQQFFINLYAFRDGTLQLSQLDRELFERRVHGFAQHATSNGGIAMFSFVYGFVIFSYFKKHRFLASILMCLSVVNIVASQARAGMIALAFAFCLLYFLNVYIYKKSLKPTLKMILGLIGASILCFYLYLKGNPFIVQMVYRWDALLETSGGERADQIDFGLSLMTNISHYLFGISRVFQSHGGIPFHLEIEFINIYVLYGLLGVILQYSLVIFLLYYFFVNLKRFSKNPPILTLLVAALVTLASYQVFSIGYFFFREIRIGLIPWILMGVTIGVCERYKIKGVQKV
ncbi:hypothetical protein [Shouchella clausii]|uniref:hypothetical protein n=1 Tax=Shouchella clausii TaxID=79880 RepID=UPI000BA71F51|nr:hypothetical protein [Shouchella clausii]PAE96541.1 hypothetical protein CHH70_01130 [Shouchella clausii]